MVAIHIPRYGIDLSFYAEVGKWSYLSWFVMHFIRCPPGWLANSIPDFCFGRRDPIAQLVLVWNQYISIVTDHTWTTRIP